MPRIQLTRFLTLTGCALLAAATSQAGIVFIGGAGHTVYGVTDYGVVPQANPQFIPNNITGNPDILSTPGGGYALADPSIVNNIANGPAPGLSPTPYLFDWIGGGNGNGDFGAGTVTLGGPEVGFTLSDTSLGCCAASYMITSWNSIFTVDGNGFNGTLGAYLAIAGTNLTSVDSSVASLVTYWSINGSPFVRLPDMVLAAGGNCNNVAIGGSGAAVINNSCTNGGNGGGYAALSIDNLGMFHLGAGTIINTVSTLTAYADPSSIDDYFISDTQIPLDALVNNAGAQFPTFSFAGVSTPEPASLLFAGLGLGACMVLRRRKALVAIYRYSRL